LEDRELVSRVIGKYIRQKRQEKDLTIEQLAELINMDDKHLSRLERGRKLPSFMTVLKIAKELEFNDPTFQYILKEIEWLKQED
jgi:transcriptional regulator with XRE-family HTH domain